jgi:hypothetical protein
MKQEKIQEVVDSFRTLDDIYIEIEKGNLSVLSRQMGTNEYPQIRWLINYFLEIEDYRKIVFLKKLKLPKVSKERIKLEKKYLKMDYYKGIEDAFKKDLLELNKKQQFKNE